jgi:hypothetical protein
MKRFGFIPFLMIVFILMTSCQQYPKITGYEDLQATNDRLVLQLTNQALLEKIQKETLSASQNSPLFPTSTPAFVPFSNQEWRFSVIEGGNKIGDDASADQDWQDNIAVHARNLAVGDPFYWEEITLPDNTRYADIQDFYLREAKNHGYKLGRSEQGVTVVGGDTYLLTFVRGSGKNASRVILEFWPKSGNQQADLMIIYSNP